MTRLSDHQRNALTAAAHHPEGLLCEEAIKDNANPKRVLTALIKRGLLEKLTTDEVGKRAESEAKAALQITEAGRTALGGSSGTETASSDQSAAAPRRTTKQDMVLSLLRQQEGASLTEIIEATCWQKHSVRGFLSGTVKKKLGLSVLSERCEARGRVYRVAEEA